jgi:hypothetical protein
MGFFINFALIALVSSTSPTSTFLPWYLGIWVLDTLRHIKLLVLFEVALGWCTGDTEEKKIYLLKKIYIIKEVCITISYR